MFKVLPGVSRYLILLIFANNILSHRDLCAPFIASLPKLRSGNPKFVGIVFGVHLHI